MHTIPSNIAHTQEIQNQSHVVMFYETLRDEIQNQSHVVMFYETLRDKGGTTLFHPDTLVLFDSPSPTCVYEAHILEEGRIAYLAVNNMINIWNDFRHGTTGYYEAMLYDFHADIEGFEHLIIDMRGSSGGVHLHFDAFVVAPLLREGIQFLGYVFYMGGDHGRTLRDIHDLRQWGMDITYAPHPANFVEPPQYLDMGINLSYAFFSTYSISPGYEYRGLHASTRQETLFNGQIWLLVDDATSYAAETAVAMLKYNNLATVVGRPTYGIMATTQDPTRVLIALPNSGILVGFDTSYFTDRQGRPLQGYGIQPHYPNRPGMDALETVLAMIEEMDEEEK